MLTTPQDDIRCATSPPPNHGDLQQHDPIRPRVQYEQQDHRADPVPVCYSAVCQVEGCGGDEAVKGDLRV